MTTDAIIDRMVATGTALADAVERELLHEISHSELKVQLIDSIIGSDNPETGKPHSATSADKAASATVTYRDSQRKGVALTKVKILCDVQWQMAKALARTIDQVAA